jgi:hypothetical protein
MMFFTPSTGARPASGEATARTLAVISTSTAVTPGNADTAACAWSRNMSFTGTRGSRQLDGERHAAAVDAEILDESKRHDVPVQIGILDDRQRAEHRRFSDHTQMIMTEREAEVEMWI